MKANFVFHAMAPRQVLRRPTEVDRHENCYVWRQQQNMSNNGFFFLCQHSKGGWSLESTVGLSCKNLLLVVRLLVDVLFFFLGSRGHFFRPLTGPFAAFRRQFGFFLTHVASSLAGSWVKCRGNVSHDRDCTNCIAIPMFITPREVGMKHLSHDSFAAAINRHA